MYLLDVSASSLSSKDFIFGHAEAKVTAQVESTKTSALVAVEKVAEAPSAWNWEDGHLFSGQMINLGSFGSFTLTPEMLEKIAPLSGSKMSVDHQAQAVAAVEAEDFAFSWLDDDFLHNLNPEVMNGHLSWKSFSVICPDR
jgi:hypothetical protein